MTPPSERIAEAAANAVREYLRADPERCGPTCRVGCPCDGGMQDAVTDAPDGAQEIVAIVLASVADPEVRVRWVRLHDKATGSYSVSSVQQALLQSATLRESPSFDVHIEEREVTPWRPADLAQDGHRD